MSAASVEFIKMILVIYLSLFWLRGIKLSSSQNSWNSLPSLLLHFSICVLHLRTSPSRLLFTLVHIYCECKWVSWKIMCNKILFQLNPKSCKKRNVFSFSRTEDEEADARDEVGWERGRRRDDNAFCASLSLDDSHSRVSLPLLPKFTFLLRFSFWLIISRSRCVFKENPIIIQWSCIPRNYFSCLSRAVVAKKRWNG